MKLRPHWSFTTEYPTRARGIVVKWSSSVCQKTRNDVVPVILRIKD